MTSHHGAMPSCPPRHRAIRLRRIGALQAAPVIARLLALLLALANLAASPGNAPHLASAPDALPGHCHEQAAADSTPQRPHAPACPCCRGAACACLPGTMAMLEAPAFAAVSAPVAVPAVMGSPVLLERALERQLRPPIA
jgi:hypothetical protein